MANVEWQMKGNYLKNCNCIATCPCDTVGLPYPGPGCEGLVGMRITAGHFGDVPLSGLSWILVFHFPGALHEGNGAAQPFIDDKASPAQREALLQIFTGKAGNPWFEIVSSLLTTLHEPQFVPIEFSYDKEKRRARMAGGSVETESAPLIIPATGDEQRVIVRMPGGMEYKEMEVAQTVVLKSDGPIKFDLKGTHSSLADIDQTHAGLVS